MKIVYEKTETSQVTYYVLPDGTVVEETERHTSKNDTIRRIEGTPQEGQIRFHQSFSGYHLIPKYVLYQILSQSQCFPEEVAKFKEIYKISFFLEDNEKPEN